MSTLHRSTAVATLISGLALAYGLAAATPVKPDKEFAERLHAYQKLRSQAEKGLTTLSKDSTPEQIHSRRLQFQQRIQALRTAAEPGEVLTPAVYELIAAVRAELSGPEGSAARAAVLGEGNPADSGVSVPLKINTPYPQEAPLSTMTPDLLARLPELPEDLQYRFVGKNLILYDVGADIVVDFITQAAN